MDKLKAFLQAFSPISDTEFMDSESNFRIRQIKKGDYFVQRGNVCKQVGFVNSGSFRTFYINDEGAEITACFRSEMSIVSSFRSFVLQESSSLSVVALEDSELIVIGYDNLQKLYATSMIWSNIGRLIAEREYINMEEYASVLNNEAAKEKYLRLLEEQGEIIHKTSVENIASYLGVTRRTLSRIRQEISS